MVDACGEIYVGFKNEDGSKAGGGYMSKESGFWGHEIIPKSQNQ
jgi:hypothetical protein